MSATSSPEPGCTLLCPYSLRQNKVRNQATRQRVIFSFRLQYSFCFLIRLFPHTEIIRPLEQVAIITLFRLYQMYIGQIEIPCLLELSDLSVHDCVEQLQQTRYSLGITDVLCRRCQHDIHIVVLCCLLHRRQRDIVQHTAITVQLLADFYRHEQERNACSSQHPCRRCSFHVTRIVVQSGNRYLHTIHGIRSHVLQKELCKSCVVDNIIAFTVYALHSLYGCKLHPLRKILVFHEICEPCTVVPTVVQSAKQRSSGRRHYFTRNCAGFLKSFVHTCKYLRGHHASALGNEQCVVHVLHVVGNRV